MSATLRSDAGAREAKSAADGGDAPVIEADGIAKTYHSRSGETPAIADITLAVGKGEFVSIVGPSGCGKSTFLHMLAGFTKPSAGTIRINGVEGGTPNLGYIFQKDTLLPWYTVRRNVGLGPRFRRRPQAEIAAKVDQLLKLAHLSEFADAYPHQLSGGMRRRVALLMSLANDPRILLLDEPFGALDTHTRTHLHRELLEIWRSLRQTIVLITHDLDEAITLSDRVIVLSAPPSRIILDERIDIAHPRDVYSVRQTPEFTLHFNRVWSVLGEEFKRGSST